MYQFFDSVKSTWLNKFSGAPHNEDIEFTTDRSQAISFSKNEVPEICTGLVTNSTIIKMNSKLEVYHVSDL